MEFISNFINNFINVVSGVLYQPWCVPLILLPAESLSQYAQNSFKYACLQSALRL